MNHLSSALLAALACAAAWLSPTPLATADASPAPFALPEQTPSHRATSSLSLPGRFEVVSALLAGRNAGGRRRGLELEGANFSSLNKIFSKISLKLPDASVSRSGLDLTITQLACRNLNVGDIRLSHAIESDTSQRVGVDVSGLRVDCSFRYEYKWAFFNGQGSGMASLDPSSSASVGLRFVSEDYAVRPPHDVSVSDCEAGLEIEDMDFDGDGLGVIEGIISLFKGLIADTVEDELGAVVCGELRGLGDDAMDDLLLALGAEVDAYLAPLEVGLADPLSMENALDVTEVIGAVGGEPAYLDFRELLELEWVSSALDRVDALLGPSGSSADAELGINNILREYFLDNDGTLEVDPSLFFASGVIFEGHDMLTQTTMSIQSVKIEGLDSFAEMDFLDAIGRHTLRNKFKLDSLRIVMEMEAEMKASSKSDAIVVAPNGNPLKEQFTVDFSMAGIEMETSIFLGINAEAIGEIELGSMLRSENILPCLMSTIDEAKFTGLSVSASDLVPPELSGFIDGGVDHIISYGAVALFHMYENTLMRAMPNFFETTVRDALNGFINDKLDGSQCPTSESPDSADEFVDFRDLFLPSANAALAGGSGASRYGNVVPWAMDIVQDQLFAADEDGLLVINKILIGPLTQAQSGTEGTVKVNGTLVDLHKEEVSRDIWKAFADSLRLTLTDLTVSGLDTLRGPIKFLEPRPSSAHLLDNQLRLGTEEKPLDASVRFGIQLGGAASPLATDNIIDLMISMPSLEVVAVLFAAVQESRLLKFPLKDAMNLSCWLSAIPISSSELLGSIDVGLAMHYLDALFEGGIRAETACVSCSNGWLENLNSVVSFLDDNGFIIGIKSRALSIVQDLLEGDWVRGIADRQIEAASRLCPHDASFGSAPVEGPAYPPFRGTRELVDGILYASFPIVQVAAVFMARKHSDLDIAPPVDIELDTPSDANLIDLTNLSSVAGWADMALEEVRNYLGVIVDGSRDIGITSMLKSLVLDKNGLMTIPIVDEGFDAGGVKLSLYDVTMVGLDSFTIFDVLKASGPSMFSNSIKLERLGVTVRMGLSVEDDSSDDDLITVSLILRDVDLNISVLMAMDQDLLGELRIGSILNTRVLVSCLLSTIHSVGLSKFVMDIGDIEEFSISGFISEDTNKSIRSITDAIFAEYKSVVLDAIPAFTSNTVRPILHNIFQLLVGRARVDGACPEPNSSMDGILDFRDLFLTEDRALELLGQGDSPYGDLVRLLYAFLEDMMSETDESGLSEMNSLVATLTKRQSSEDGELYYPGHIFKQDLDIALGGLNAVIELGVSDVRVSNIDTLGTPIKVLQPVAGEPSVLNNTAIIGAGQDPLRAEMRLLIKGRGDEIEVHNDLLLGLSLKNVGMMLEVLAQIGEMPFLNLPLQDVMNLQCWLATVVTPALDNYGIRVGDTDSGIVIKKLAFAIAEARLDIDCISCSSPLILDMASKLGSPEAVEDTTLVANMIVEYLSNLLGGDFVQSALDKMLNEAAMKCPHSPLYKENFQGLKYDELELNEKAEDTFGFLIAIICVIAISVVAVIVIVGMTKCISRRRHDRWVETLNRDQKLELERMQKDEREREKDLNKRMCSLVRSEEVPLFLRLFIPVVIIGNIALFLSGHLSLGGTVSISGSFAGQHFDVDGFFEFSMAKSTIEMWKAGAKSLAVLIVIFSGLWPYTKQLFTLFIWFAPPTRLSSKRRGSILRWLDVLGKWSMIDVFVLLMTLASFRLSVESPDHLNFLPKDLYSINMLVVPLWGLYANMLAQLVAQVSSHLIIYYHRKTIKTATRAQEVELDLPTSSEGKTREMLWLHSFKLDYEASSKRANVRRSVHGILSVAVLTFVILVVCGCALPSFSIEVLGLVGLAVESGNQLEQAKVFYGAFDLANMIMDQARYLNTAADLVGLGTFSSLLVITVFLVPLAQAASLAAQWFAPMTKKQRMRNAVFNEVLSAWQYMEVYVLSIVISAWQLGGVSEYMINAYCGSLKGTFNYLAYYGILDEDDAQCFRVNATVESASWVLVAASLILFILSHFISEASLQKIQDDCVPAEQRLHTDRWLQTKQSTVTIGVGISISRSGEEGCQCLGDVIILPVKPRFTDYYFFATTHSSERQIQDYDVEIE